MAVEKEKKKHIKNPVADHGEREGERDTVQREYGGRLRS